APCAKSPTQSPMCPDFRLPRIAFEPHNDPSALAAGTSLHASFQTLREPVILRQVVSCEGCRVTRFSLGQTTDRDVSLLKTTVPIIRQLQDQRRVIGKSGDPLFMGVVDGAGASGQLL